MGKDARWPVLPMVLLRGVQIFFGILALGMAGYLVAANRNPLEGLSSGITFLRGGSGGSSTSGSGGYGGSSYGDSSYGDSGFGDSDEDDDSGSSPPPTWGYPMALTAALLTIFYAITNFVLLAKHLLLPVAVVVVDTVIIVLWVTALGGLGITSYLTEPCSLFGSLFGFGLSCQLVKAAFGISFIILLTFLGTLVIASIALHRTRKDIRGTMYNSGLDPEGNPLPGATATVTVDNVQAPGSAANTYYQEPKQYYAPTPLATPVYYNHQNPVASPPLTTGPYMPPQGMPQPPPNSAPMAGY